MSLSSSKKTYKTLALPEVSRLIQIMDELRVGCPWDQKQTFESLSGLTIEETYELVEAIRANDLTEIEKELGDLLLHIVFYAKIGSESNSFTLESVAHKISEKLIFRHPHIYGTVKVSNQEEVKKNWEALKLKEKGNKGVLSGVPKSLPSLVKAYRMQQKAAAVGFDWPTPQDVMGKVREELQKFEEELVKNNTEAIEEEFGDLLFSLVNYGRALKINPQQALEKTNQKFKRRFEHIEAVVSAKHQSLQDLSLEQMDAYWNEAKVLEKTENLKK